MLRWSFLFELDVWILISVDRTENRLVLLLLLPVVEVMSDVVLDLDDDNESCRTVWIIPELAKWHVNGPEFGWASESVNLSRPMRTFPLLPVVDWQLFSYEFYNTQNRNKQSLEFCGKLRKHVKVYGLYTSLLSQIM